MPAKPTLLTAALLTALLSLSAHAADWPQFRGPNCTGRADAGKLPAEIGPDTNVVWKVEVPPGHSSPAVVGDRIYLTAERDKKLFTVALSRRDGKTLWEAEAPHQGLEKVHKIGSHAQPSPAADAGGVVSFFGSCGLFCYDPDGKELWRRAMGPFKNEFGAGSSPVIVGDRVLLCQDHDQDSFLTALDRRNGETVWKADRSEFLRGFCTPVVWESGGKKQVVVSGTLRVAGYDLETGKEVWTVRGLARTACSTPAVGGDGLLYVAGWAAGGDADARIKVEPFEEALRKYDKNGNGKLEAAELTEGPIAERFLQVDTDKDGSITEAEYERFRLLFEKGQNVLLTVKPGGKGDVTDTHVGWRDTKQVPFCASPLVEDGLVFTVKDGGWLAALDTKDGSLLKRGRLPGSGNYYGSPVAGDGKVYLASERGSVTVVSASKDWKVLASADFEEDVYATPALVDGKVYLRTAKHLYCFGLPAGK
jgi:outer membrane protein assembly factor BamB